MKSNPSRTLFRTLFATGLLAASLCSCCPKHNTLTQAEIADGWQLLFDGKSLDQWKDFNGDSLTMPWHVVDGCIQAAGDGSDLSGYIVTKKQYENFILDWDWKLSYGGNSGMLYHVVENPYFKVPYVTGPESVSYTHLDVYKRQDVSRPVTATFKDATLQTVLDTCLLYTSKRPGPRRASCRTTTS